MRKKANKTKTLFIGKEMVTEVISFSLYLDPIFDWILEYLNISQSGVEGAMIDLSTHTMFANYEEIPDWSWLSFGGVFSSSFTPSPDKIDTDVYLKSPAGLLHVTTHVSVGGFSGDICFVVAPSYRWNDFSPLFDVMESFNEYRSHVSDCRSEEGITEGLISSLISICRVLAERDLSPLVVQEALLDLLGDEDLAAVLDEAKKVHEGQENE